MSEQKECESCEGFWSGKGYCKECGSFDTCYYALCDLTSKQMDDVLDFVKDMQGNPQLKNLS